MASLEGKYALNWTRLIVPSVRGQPGAYTIHVFVPGSTTLGTSFDRLAVCPGRSSIGRCGACRSS